MTVRVDGEAGPDCECGDPTVVRIMPDGSPALLCLFHDGEAGRITALSAERPR
jgi:hypothetical protein